MGHPLELDAWDDEIDERVEILRDELAALAVTSVDDSRKHLPGLVSFFRRVLRELNKDDPDRLSELEETRQRLPFGYSIWPPRSIGEPLHRYRRYKELAIEVTELMHEALDWLIETSFRALGGSDATAFPRQTLRDLKLLNNELDRLFKGLHKQEEEQEPLDKHFYTERIQVLVAPLEEGVGSAAVSYHSDYYRPRGVRGPRLLVTEVLDFPPKPKFLPLLATFEARRSQVDFGARVVKELNALAGDAPIGAPVLVWPGFPHRDEDLRSLLELVYFENGGGYGVAIDRVLPILRAYYEGFTLSSTNNVPDEGLGPKSKSYLNAKFPRAMTGQRIHDCAVFAVRTAFLMGGILRDLGLTPYFGNMPLHMGLVALASDSLEAEDGSSIPAETLLSGGLFIAHNQGLLLYKQAEFTDAIDNWETYDAPCSSDDALQLAGETFTAGFWGRSVLDTPFRLQPVKDTSKAGVWSAYLAILSTGLFAGSSAQDSLPIAYFRFMDASKTFYNTKVRQFWNVKASEIYNSIMAPVGPHGLPGAAMAPLKRIVLVTALDSAFSAVEGEFLTLAAGHWPAVDIPLCASPTPLAQGVRASCAARAGGLRGLDLTRSGGCMARKLEPVPWSRERDGPLLLGWQLRMARYIQKLRDQGREVPDPPFIDRLPLQT